MILQAASSYAYLFCHVFIHSFIIACFVYLSIERSFSEIILNEIHCSLNRRRVMCVVRTTAFIRSTLFARYLPVIYFLPKLWGENIMNSLKTRWFWGFLFISLIILPLRIPYLTIYNMCPHSFYNRHQVDRGKSFSRTWHILSLALSRAEVSLQLG